MHFIMCRRTRASRSRACCTQITRADDPSDIDLRVLLHHYFPVLRGLIPSDGAYVLVRGRCCTLEKGAHALGSGQRERIGEWRRLPCPVVFDVYGSSLAAEEQCRNTNQYDGGMEG